MQRHGCQLLFGLIMKGEQWNQFFFFNENICIDVCWHLAQSIKDATQCWVTKTIIIIEVSLQFYETQLF